jgi:SAM-dependent methyltransferase
MSGATTPAPAAHEGLEASPWIRRWSALLPPGARVLDVACGGGRHLAWLGAAGHRVCGVDRDAGALETARARPGGGEAELVHADLESAPWPLPGRRFDAVVVTNYLWRPLLPTIVASVAPGGLLLYETFAAGNETVGRPSNPDFLLRPGELLDAVRGELRVIAYEDGFLDPPPRFVQRIAARREPEASTGRPARLPL